MALSCNALADNAAGATACATAQAAPHLGNLGNNELFTEQFMLLVLDSLRRTLPGAYANMLAAPACDLADALRFGSCAMQTIQPQFQVTPAQMQAQILYIFNDILCSS